VRVEQNTSSSFKLPTITKKKLLTRAFPVVADQLSENLDSVVKGERVRAID